MTREVMVADTSYVGAAQRVAERRADYGWPRLVVRRLTEVEVVYLPSNRPAATGGLR